MADEDADSGGEPVRAGAVTALLKQLAMSPERVEAAWETVLYPGAMVGRFELIREVGRGGFGVVWEAKDQQLGRRVAFKAIRRGEAASLREERLLEEAEAAARLSHPNIVTLYDVGRADAGPYLVLEFLRGRTLAARLASERVPAKEALEIAREIAKGVAHAHAQGVIHRDLKPENVFLCDDGRVKVLDFGLAHAFGKRKPNGGTPGYMAPEQLRDAPEDERADVYALGVILYRILTGRMPAAAAYGSEGVAPTLEVAAPSIGPLIAKMMASDPVDRPRNGSAVVEALLAAEQELPQAGLAGDWARDLRRRGLRPPEIRRPGTGRKWRVGLAIAFLFVAGAATWGWRNFRSRLARHDDALASIMVARFATQMPVPESEGHVLQRLIIQKLVNYTAGEPRLAVSAEDIAPNSEMEARRLGLHAGADVVGWGELLSADGEIHLQAYATPGSSPSMDHIWWNDFHDIRATRPIAAGEEHASVSAQGQRNRQADGIARALLRKALWAHPDAPFALSVLARVAPPDPSTEAVKAGLLMQSERYAEARSLLERALRSWPDDRDLLIQTIGLKILAVEDASAEVERLAAMDPAAGAYERMRIAAWQGRDVEKSVREALALTSGDPRTHAFAAEALAEIGKTSEAANELRMAERGCRKEDALWTVAWPWIHLDSPAEAIRVAKDALAAWPEDPRLVEFAAFILRKAKDFSGAEQAIRRIIDTTDKASARRLHWQLIHTLRDAGRVREAEQELQSEISGSGEPDQADLRVGLADLLALEGRFADAEREYRAAIASGPENSRARRELGELLARTGRIDAALQEFETARSLGDDSVELPLMRTYLELERFDDALASTRHIRPGYPDARQMHLYYQCLAHIRLKQSAKAIEISRETALAKGLRFLVLARLHLQGVEPPISASVTRQEVSLAEYSSAVDVAASRQFAALEDDPALLAFTKEAGPRGAQATYYLGMARLLGIRGGKADPAMANKHEARRCFERIVQDRKIESPWYDFARVELAWLR